MRVSTLVHHESGGWTANHPSQLDSPKTLVLVFGSPSYGKKREVIEEISSSFQSSVIIGCSTSGNILDHHLLDNSLVATVVQFEDSSIHLAGLEIDSAERSREVGRKLAIDLPSEGLRSVFLLSKGLDVNGSELAAGLNEELAKEVIVTGALAGDEDRFEKTWIIKGNEVLDSHAVAVGFYGESIRVGHGYRGGWDIFGPLRQVTKSEGNVLYELDGKPALELYKEYLGELAKDLPASALRFPLAVSENVGSEEQLVRTILAVDFERNSMTFAGDISKGSYAQLMRANYENLVDGASQASLMTDVNSLQCQPTLAVAVSCVGRRIVLGEAAEDELEASLEAFPEGTTQVGFYSYGELSPHTNGRCELHNQTMTLTTICECNE